MKNRIIQHALPIALTIMVIAIALGQEYTAHWLRYQRESILDGDLWRLITGNMTHLGWSHVLWNVTGLWLIWLLFWHYLSSMQWIIVFLAGALGTGLGLLAFNPMIEWYVGLSGVLHGQFIAGGLTEIRHGRRGGMLLLGLLAAKLVWEQFQGPLPGTTAAAGGNVIVDAHLYGAIAGLVALFFKFKKSNPE